jgi:hypothetical protein
VPASQSTALLLAIPLCAFVHRQTRHTPTFHCAVRTSLLASSCGLRNDSRRCGGLCFQDEAVKLNPSPWTSPSVMAGLRAWCFVLLATAFAHAARHSRRNAHLLPEDPPGVLSPGAAQSGVRSGVLPPVRGATPIARSSNVCNVSILLLERSKLGEELEVLGRGSYGKVSRVVKTPSYPALAVTNPRHDEFLRRRGRRVAETWRI